MRSLLTALAVFVIFSTLCWAQQPESAPTQAPPAKTTTKEKKPSPPPKVPEGKPQETPSSPEEAKPETGRATPADKDKEKEKDERYDVTEVPPVVTHHQITVDGKALRYTATAGRLPVKRDDGKIEAEMFFVAYTLDGQDASKRPLTFAFNGGPGSASVWLHMGALGPKRVVLQPQGFMPAAPYRMADNQNSLLDKSDIVMVDAIGTGFSRAANADLSKKYWGVKGDIEAFGEFIRLYITRYDRWSSPLFLLGESYGTTRAAGVAGYLADHGISFNGITLLSIALSFQTLEWNKSNDLPYVLLVPTYTMIAAYHKKLPPDLMQDLAKTRQEVEQWVSTEYAKALSKGDALTPEERQKIIAFQEGGFEKWDWGSAIQGFPDTATALRAAIVKNPYLKVLVMEGYYDLATPFYAADYTMDHLDLNPNYRKNISFATYDSGH